MDALAGLKTKIAGANDLKSVVKSMKAMAAANIGQYELAVKSLDDYYHAVTLGVIAYLKHEKIVPAKAPVKSNKKNKEKTIYAIVFGSDQGLVGQFNNVLTTFVSDTLHSLPGEKQVWGVGSRIELLLLDTGLKTTKNFTVPASVDAITPLVQDILLESEKVNDKNKNAEFYVFHNRPKTVTGYEPVCNQLLPLDEKWMQQFVKLPWPTKLLPEMIGGVKPVLLALIREYLFVSLFKASAESLASENTSRLEAMQRAEKNIGELLTKLNHKYHQLRQGSIDEELFDVIAGFEALKTDKQL